MQYEIPGTLVKKAANMAPKDLILQRGGQTEEPMIEKKGQQRTLSTSFSLLPQCVTMTDIIAGIWVPPPLQGPQVLTAVMNGGFIWT